MWENVFSPSPWVWAGLLGGLALLPPLIHLINQLRHRRIKWAAMEFLLRSYQKNKNWIRLKQFLLLAARILTLIGFLLLLSNVGCERNQFARLFGGAPIHHYIVLDDSISMSQSNGNETVFDRARQAIALIALRAGNRPNQFVTLLRTSQGKAAAQLRQLNPAGQALPEPLTEFELNAVRVDSRFGLTIQSLLGELNPTLIPASPMDALERIVNAIAARNNESSIVYLVSDFREADWTATTGCAAAVDRLAEHGASVEFIQCCDEARDNLALADLQAEGSVRVAGTPFMIQVTIKNFGQSTARNIQIAIKSAPLNDLNVTLPELRTADGLPSVIVEELEAGETETRRFPVYFPVAGPQIIWASTGHDVLTADNSRWLVVDVAQAAKVLVIATKPELLSAMRLALNPARLTGLEPEFRGSDFLRDVAPDVLHDFACVFLVDAPRLDPIAIEKLEGYCRGGGGVAFFLGPNVNGQVYNETLFRGGTGLFPLKLGNSVELSVKSGGENADIQAIDHALTKPYTQNSSVLLDLVQLRQFIGVDRQWLLENRLTSQPAEQGGLEIAATVRGNPEQPLIATKRYGQGNVIVVTTTADSQWNNWQSTPTYPPMILVMEDYAAAGKFVAVQHETGHDIAIGQSLAKYLPDITLSLPAANMAEKNLVSTTLAGGDEAIGRATVRWFSPTGDPMIAWPGIARLDRQSKSGLVESQSFAINVDTSDSDLPIKNRRELLSSFKVAQPTFTTWDRFNPDPEPAIASPVARVLLFALLILMLGEQALAFVNSYHSARGARTR